MRWRRPAGHQPIAEGLGRRRQNEHPRNNLNLKPGPQPAAGASHSQNTLTSNDVNMLTTSDAKQLDRLMTDVNYLAIV